MEEQIRLFRRMIWKYHRTHGRHTLPWRQTHDVYKILVSEVMLQQTQVDRVVPFYTKFIAQFPTAKKLANAQLADVLRAWQGLGYNRRAKLLWLAAKALAATRLNLVAQLEKLPGVGPYTARAIAAFAYNRNVVFVETNIRTAIIEHFFPHQRLVSDTAIEDILQKTLPRGRAREWYGVLMDYGASLKKSGVSHNARSAKYMKQSKFAGSLREARGAILRELARGAASPAKLTVLLGDPRRAQMRAALRALWDEGLVSKAGEQYTLAS